MKQNKNLGLEGLRGLACMAVMIGHFSYIFSPYLASLFRPVPFLIKPSALERWISIPPLTLAYSADAAVCVFFVMSGYVLTTKFFTTEELPALQSAAAKRYIRLGLPSFASIFLAWILWRSGAIYTAHASEIGVAGWVSSWYAGPFTFSDVFTDGLAGAPLFSRTALNPALWTIQVELIGSIVLFAIIALFGKRPILLVLWFLFFANIFGLQSPNVLFYLSFLAGAILNIVRPWLIRNQVASLVTVSLGIYGVAYNQQPMFDILRMIPLPNLKPLGPNFNDNPDLLWHTVGSILLVAGVIGSRRLSAIIGSRIPVFLGKISFSIYVIHVPVLASVGLRVAAAAQNSGLRYEQSVALAFVAYVMAVIGGAILFERWIDAPSIRLANRMANRAASVEKLQGQSIAPWH
ncbi:acyltransferase [Burkholderia thailandensis]|uniref:acyltransferase family protein n=2 Tax=Burkholderia thailandensis TaxID=57975 RepID=UPI00107ECB49|nr:acyltransferase [Burkholderia thailandensis]MCZ2897709.1 acyltransferase [Burkholderia thailandensis]TGB31966.1 acyltransferase [Burkholderia thailandensis]